ncbi:MAG: (deoxy)nucleoside triphosphate pyrophosphohydrolase [Planctomycetaceae bacterium]
MAEFRRKTIGIAVVEHQGSYLIGIRPPGASLAGFAEFPGGKCEADEEPAIAAVRECWEETGLRVEVLELLTRRLYEYAYGAVDLHFYLCRPLEVPNASGDLQGFRWEEVSALRSLKFPDANLPVLELLEKRAGTVTDNNDTRRDV